MSSLKAVEIEVEGARDLALIASDDSVWIVIPLRWWDLATLVWWLFCPSDRKSKITLTTGDDRKVTFRAARVASRHIRVRGRIS